MKQEDTNTKVNAGKDTVKEKEQGQETEAKRSGGKNNKPRNNSGNNKPGNNSGSKPGYKGNDVKWYTRFPQLAKDAASFSFYNPVGTTIDVINNTEDWSPEPSVKVAVRNPIMPGILKLVVRPTIGYSDNASSAVNAAARALYTFVRHANSGKTNYESTDLMMYMLAVNSVYKCWTEIVRTYGILRTYSVTNRYIPMNVARALGCDAGIISNLADLRYGINYLATRLNTLAVPKDMYLFDQGLEEALFIYSDSNNDKAQLYAFQSESFLKWSPRTSQTGSELLQVTSPMYNGSCTASSMLEYCRSLIDQLLADEDVGIMSGDILKAFGSSGLKEIKAINEDFGIVPIFDQNKLEQIHNANIIPCGDLTGWKISQNISTTESYIISKPTVASIEITSITRYVVDGNMKLWMDSSKDSPTPDDILEMCRFKAGLDIDEADSIRLIAFGTSVVSAVEIYTVDPFNTNNNKLGVFRLTEYIYDVYSARVNNELTDFIIISEYLHKFDWAPIIPCAGLTPTSNANQLSLIPLGEVFNYSVITVEQLHRIHDLMLTSLTIVPNMANVAKERVK